MDAVTLSGLRLLKAIGIATDAKAIGRKQSGNPDRESGEVSRENTWRLPFVGDVGWKAFESQQKLLYGCQPASNKNYIIVVMIEVGNQTLDTMVSISFPWPSGHVQLLGLGAGVLCDARWSLQSSAWLGELWPDLVWKVAHAASTGRFELLPTCPRKGAGEPCQITARQRAKPIHWYSADISGMRSLCKQLDTNPKTYKN